MTSAAAIAVDLAERLAAIAESYTSDVGLGSGAGTEMKRPRRIWRGLVVCRS